MPGTCDESPNTREIPLFLFRRCQRWENQQIVLRNFNHPIMKTRFLAVVCLSLAVSLVPFLKAEEADPGLLRAKAEKGNVLAQYNLGLAYAEGRGIPQDLVEAYVWLRLATDNGGTGTALGGVLHQMSIEQIAAGRLRLEELRRTLPAVVADHHAAAPAVAATRPAAPAPTEDRFVAMQEELAALRVDNARLTQRLAAMPVGPVTPAAAGSPADQKKIADLGAQLDIVRKEQAAAGKANEDLSARVKALIDENEALKLQAAGRGDDARRLAEAQGEIEQLKKDNAGLKTQCDELSARQAKAEVAAPSPVASAAPAVAAAPAGADELRRLKEDLGRANSKVEMTVRTCVLLREENERLKAQLAQVTAP
jgi:regulator of replication initiation timing